MRWVDCSKVSDPQLRNSCHQVECLFSKEWERWGEQSEVRSVWSPVFVWCLQNEPGQVRGGDYLDTHRTASRHINYVVSIRRRHWPASGRGNEGSRRGGGSSFESHVTAVQLSHPNHPSHSAFADDRTLSDAGVQPGTVSVGLLQRCVVWSSSQ